MGFQTSVRQFMTTGIVGDICIQGAVRSQPGILVTEDPTNNVIGRAVTHVANSDGQFEAGGEGVFAGILTNSKNYALYGGLTPTITLPNNIPVEATTFASGIIVSLADAATIGQAVFYSTTTGELKAGTSGTTISGYAEIPNSKVVRNNTSAAGLAIIELTN